MKTTFKLLSLLTLTALAAAPLVRAEDAPATPTTPPAGEHGRGERGGRMKMLAEKLQLTDAQKAQVKTIMSSVEEQAKALRDDETLAKEDKRAKMMEIRKSTHDQIRALLTPDQQKTFDAMPPPPERGHRGPPKGADALPAPPKQ